MKETHISFTADAVMGARVGNSSRAATNMAVGSNAGTEAVAAEI